ncbi:MAG: hypothetical protein JWQ38_935 [Flavipsychrobacter sp.]|nr:hypothetical protein [Flavipsychrobacter sp.]
MNGQYRDHVWTNFSKSIMATDAGSAVFLASFLQYLGNDYEYTSVLEVIDLQKYKVIKPKTKVRIALRERIKMPFVFVVGKN